MTRRFAADTEVPVEKTRMEIEKVLTKFGASHFGYATGPEGARIMFKSRGRNILFVLPLPDKTAPEFTLHANSTYRMRTAEGAQKAWEQACRSRWRALLLSVKAKLEAVEIGITEFEDEFLAHIVMPNGETVSEAIRPQIERSYKAEKPTPLLLGGPRS